jgi:hypothetical protein
LKNLYKEVHPWYKLNFTHASTTSGYRKTGRIYTNSSNPPMWASVSNTEKPVLGVNVSFFFETSLIAQLKQLND